MGGFFKMFFASLLALLIFSLLAFFLMIVFVAGIAKSDKPKVQKNSVIVLSLDQPYFEQQLESPLAGFSSNDQLRVPGLYDVIRLVKHAKNDPNIKGIFLTGGLNANGFAASDEIRNALEDFKKSSKFIIAYSEIMSQK